MASQKQLEGSRITGKGHSHPLPFPSVSAPPSEMVAGEDNVLHGQPLHPAKHAVQVFTDTSKEGWGAHLNEHTARGTWSLPESKLHINDLELKAVFLALEFQDLCSGKNGCYSNRQPHSGVIHKQGRRSGPLCAYWGGGSVAIAPGNRLLVTDHGLTGFPDLRVDPGLEKVF